MKGWGGVCTVWKEGEGLMKEEREERGRNVSFPDLVLGRNQSRTVVLLEGAQFRIGRCGNIIIASVARIT